MEQFVDNSFNQIIDFVAENIRQGSLKNQTDNDPSIRQQALSIFQNYKDNLNKGGKLLLELDETGKIKVFFKKLVEAISKAYPTQSNTPETMEQLYSVMNTFTNEEFDLLYDIAMKEYGKGMYQNTLQILSIITTLFPSRVIVWIAIAMTEWKLKGHKAAKVIYDKLVTAMPHPTIYLYAGDFYNQIGDKNSAKNALQAGIAICQKDSAMANDYLEALEGLLESI